MEIEGLRIGSPGVHRLTVTTGDGSLSAQSNPVRSEVAPKARVYWGDMHCHADYADATGTAEWNHDYARNKARLDFYSLTDHIYSTPGRATGAFNRPPVLDVRKMWGEVQRTARDWHEPGRFVTFLGYERTPWERRRAAGDLTVWFMEDDAELVIEDTIAETIEAVRATNGGGVHRVARGAAFGLGALPGRRGRRDADDRDFGDASARRVVRVRGVAAGLQVRERGHGGRAHGTPRL